MSSSDTSYASRSASSGSDPNSVYSNDNSNYSDPPNSASDLSQPSSTCDPPSSIEISSKVNYGQYMLYLKDGTTRLGNVTEDYGTDFGNLLDQRDAELYKWPERIDVDAVYEATFCPAYDGGREEVWKKYRDCGWVQAPSSRSADFSTGSAVSSDVESEEEG